MSRVRPLVIGLFSHRGKILVNEAHDPVKDQRFCRPLGGEIEFGETAEQALVREIREEIGAEVASLRFAGVLENLFTFLGQPGHEIVLVYDGRLADETLYAEGTVIPGAESDGSRFTADWRGLDAFGPSLPLYPNGLAELIRSVGLLPEGR